MSSVPAPSASSVIPAVIELRIAGRPGPTFVLDPTIDNVLGRSTDALVALPDRLASRMHAALRIDQGTGGWSLHDLASRNGTWLDGARITSAPVRDGAVIRVGTSELVFRHGEAAATSPPAVTDGEFVRCGPVGQFAGLALTRSGSGRPEDSRWPLLLYQAGIRLLVSHSIREVIGATLELAAEHSGAATFGWFRASAADRLEPVCVVPPGSSLAGLLGDAAARLIVGERKAVWMSAADRSSGGSAAKFDLMCVPIVEGERVHAMLAAAAPAGSLRDADFDFLVALSSLASAACTGHDAAAQSGGEGSRATAMSMLPTVACDDSAFDPPAEADDEPPAAGTFVLDAAEAAAALQPGPDHPAADRIGSAVADSPTLRLDDWQRVLVIEALRRCGGSVPNAAAELGISRATLYRKLESYGLARR